MCVDSLGSSVDEVCVHMYVLYIHIYGCVYEYVYAYVRVSVSYVYIQYILHLKGCAFICM